MSAIDEFQATLAVAADMRSATIGVGTRRYSQVQVFATAPAQSADRKTHTVCHRGA
jgi:hypothetical protein